ncbi:GNAT family N-acetyltransferase [Microvirga subterranea]|uniref:Putative N-acetyltransferase YhbS n=1 Tax=Microvirga subterranea TaxID=186651 RepID=A0A370HLM5_9HYPH|nr:GNAT family N-acetyltransferase [Microvirga subterranea]RDI59482.1 putative N-acetyltransferase YhbS [Microvirga subterranea]
MSRGGYAIRAARPDDLAALAGVERSAAVTYFAALGEPHGIPDAMPPEALESCHAAGLLWVAADRHDAPAGFLAAQVVDGMLFVKEMSVARAHQRAGLGRRLMRTAEEHAQEAGFAAVALTTDRLIPFNGPFYARLGFAEVALAEASPGLRRIVAEEIAAGFDPARRIVMTKPLAALQAPSTPLYREEV